MTSQKPTALQSLAAGAAAGGVESFVTYPTEYIKTRKQLLSSSYSTLRILGDAIRSSAGPRVVYTGASAFCISNTAKSGVRFLTFDTVRNLLPVDTSTGKPLPVSTMLAGMAAGIAESISVLTPGENLKTKLVQDQSGKRQLRSATHALRVIVAKGGLPGAFRGVVPVTIKQSSNALVRFTSYSTLLDWVKPRLEEVGSGAMAPAVAGAAAGIITVYATMPFDVVKTRMQGQGDTTVRTFTAFRTIMQQSGARGLWRGTTPRLVRLSISGALSFSIYENVVRLLRIGEDRGNAGSLA